ncbi:CYTH domain-containing protein [Desulfobulbus propionicus]|jgi:adenylate cyclase
MALEIERKFLLATDQWRGLAAGVHYRQGYLHASRECTVRIRIAGSKAYLTVKGATHNASRSEYEYAIPLEDARAMLDELCSQPQIEKLRYTIPYQGFTWEVDEFLGMNQGLIIAEIELSDERQNFPKPEWIGREVTGDSRYYNAALCQAPYSNWGEPAS